METGSGSVVTIGAFDGLHLGHRKVIEDVVELARSKGMRSVAVTFDRHPAAVVRPDSAPQLLTDLPQKLSLLDTTSISHIHVVPFTKERAAESAEDFVMEVLVGELDARVVVVGRDFHFGRDRGGNVALLEEMGREHGFSVLPYELVTDDSTEDGGETISSTRIRRLISAGELSEAGRLLGRPHEVRGLVVAPASGFTGAGEGSSGVSVEVPAEILLPPPGGYVGRSGLVPDGDGGGASASALERCRIMVPPSGALAVLGTSQAWPVGRAVRVLFDGPDAGFR